MRHAVAWPENCCLCLVDTPGATLTAVADHLSEQIRWRGPVALEMSTCNEPAPRWDLSARKIIVRHELAADFAQLYREYAVKQKQVAQKHK